MPNVSGLNTRLTVLANQWKPSARGYIASQALPIWRVSERKFNYLTFDKTEIFSVVTDPRRADAGYAKEVTWSVTETSSETVPYALRDFLTDRQIASKQYQIAWENNTVTFLCEQLALAYEKRIADYLFSGTTFSSHTAALSGTDRWDDSTSDPRKTFLTYAGTTFMHMRPNTLIIGEAVRDALMYHPALAGLKKYTNGIVGVTETDLAAYFGVDQVLVGKALYNASDHGASASYGNLWGKYALLAYLAPGGGGPLPPRQPSLGYNFMLDSQLGSGVPGAEGIMRVRSYRDEGKGGAGSWYEVDHESKALVIDTTCGYLLSTVVS